MIQRPIIITSMLRNKYKLSKNNGLLPKIISKSSQINLKTFALLNKCSQKQYQLHIHPSDPKKFIMFNQNEYLQRQCSSVIVDNSATQTIQAISKLYPSEGPTLAMFIANEPYQSDTIIQGMEGKSSILSLVFNNLRQSKSFNEEIFLSIIGVQNENSLTDELHFQQINDRQELQTKKEPNKQMITSKSKIKVTRQKDTHIYYPQNVSRPLIKTQEALGQLLKKYRSVKTCFQEWMCQKQERQYYLMGEIYQMGLAEYDKNTNKIIKINKVHYIFKINQYIRTTSPILLKLGMNMKRVVQKNYQLLHIHDCKVFKLLSECFSLQENKSSLLFNHYLFLQVGEYYSFKQEYLCLVPVSEFTVDKLDQEQQNINELFFYYTKHYMENPIILNIIVEIENNLSQKQKEQIFKIIKNHQQTIYPSKIRLKTKSYNCDTVCSIEKKVLRNHLLTQQSQLLYYPQLQLDQIVHQTSKMFRLPSINKISLAQSKKSSNRIRLLSRNQQSFNLKLLQKQQIASFSPLNRLNNHSNKNKLTQKCNQIQSAFLPKQQNMEKESINKSGKFYKESKDWLNHVYGKTLLKKSKPKYFYKSVDIKQQNSQEVQAQGIKIDQQIPTNQVKQQKNLINIEIEVSSIGKK